MYLNRRLVQLREEPCTRRLEIESQAMRYGATVSVKSRGSGGSCYLNSEVSTRSAYRVYIEATCDGGASVSTSLRVYLPVSDLAWQIS